MSHQANEAYVVEADDLVPILTPTADILPRLKTLADHFVSKYNVEPSFFARVPGRWVILFTHNEIILLQFQLVDFYDTGIHLDCHVNSIKSKIESDFADNQGIALLLSIRTHSKLFLI